MTGGGLLIPALLATLSAAAASAQDPKAPGPELEVRSCEAFANRTYKRANPALSPVTIEWDRALHVASVDSKAGRQPVTTVLTGLASHATPGGRQETTFLCLLAKPERAVFFHLNPGGTRVIDSSADPLKTCLDLVGSQAGVDGCLAARLRDAETMLDGVVAAKGRELESLERAGSRSGAPAVLAQAQDAWLTFRNTTCRLEGAAAKSDASALDFERACQVRLTLERAIALGTH